MKALVVAPQPFFSPRGTPFSVYYRTAIAAELGVKIDLLTYGQGQDVDIPGVRIHRIPAFRFLGPVPVGPSLLKAFLDVFMVLRAFLMLARGRYDFVHAHEEAVFFMRWLKPIFGFRLVYDMHSCLPQQLTNFSFTRSRLLIALFERLENACLESAEAVITIAPALEAYAVERMPDPRRHVLIENSIFEEVRLSGASGEDELPDPLAGVPRDRPRVVYAGTFESYQGIDLLLKAWAEVLRERPGPLLALLGGNAEQVETQRRLARELGIEGDCLFAGSVPPAAARRAVRGATVLVSPRTEGDNTPLKLYEYLASGIPFVATDIASHTQLVDPSTCFLTAAEPAAFARGILDALGDEARARQRAAAAAELYERRYSRRAYVDKMRDVLGLVEPCAA